MNKKIVNEMLNIAIDNIEAITEPKDKVVAISAFLTMLNEILPGGVESLEDGEEEKAPKESMKKEASKKSNKASNKKEAEKASKNNVKEKVDEEDEETNDPIILVDDNSEVSIAEGYEENEFAQWIIEAINYYSLKAINEELMVFSSDVYDNIADIGEEELEAFVNHLAAKIDAQEEGDEE